MISDVLFEALRQIESYQRECPHAYDAMRAEIDKVKTTMNVLRCKLDNAQFSGDFAELTNLAAVTDLATLRARLAAG